MNSVFTPEKINTIKNSNMYIDHLTARCRKMPVCRNSVGASRSLVSHSAIIIKAHHVSAVLPIITDADEKLLNINMI